MKRRKSWMPGWCRVPGEERPAPTPAAPKPGIEEWLEPPTREMRALALKPEKKSRARGGGPLPVRSSSEQRAARLAAAAWSSHLGGLDLSVVAQALEEARREAAALGHLIDKDQDKAMSVMAKLPTDVRDNVSLTLASGEEALRRARAAAIQASFQLGLVKKLLVAGWLPAGPEEIHAGELAAFNEAAKRWAFHAQRRKEKGPAWVKGSPRTFPRNNF